MISSVIAVGVLALVGLGLLGPRLENVFRPNYLTLAGQRPSVSRYLARSTVYAGFGIFGLFVSEASARFIASATGDDDQPGTLTHVLSIAVGTLFEAVLLYRRVGGQRD